MSEETGSRLLVGGPLFGLRCPGETPLVREGHHQGPARDPRPLCTRLDQTSVPAASSYFTGAIPLSQPSLPFLLPSPRHPGPL